MPRLYRALVPLIVLTACAESAVLEPNASELATTGTMTPISQQNGSLRPAGGRCTLVARNLLSPTHRILDYECQLQHLGQTTARVDETTAPAPGGVAVTAAITYTAANGDQLYVSFVGSGFAQDGIGFFSGTETVTGGTGRFAGATGSLSRAGSSQLPPGFGGHYETEGTLTY